MSKKAVAFSKQGANIQAASGTLATVDCQEFDALMIVIDNVAFTGGASPNVALNIFAVTAFGTATLSLGNTGTVLNGGAGSVFYVNTSSNTFPPPKIKIQWTTTGAPTTGTCDVTVYGQYNS